MRQLPIERSEAAHAYPSTGRFVKIVLVDNSMGGALVGREWTFEVETQVPLEQIKDHCARNHVQACTAFVYEPSCKGYSHQPKVFEGRWDGVRISLIEVSAGAASGGAYRYE